MLLKPATAHDAQILFEWRNDPITRENSRNTEPLLWSDHVRWLAHTLKRADRKLLIAELDGLAVGTVRMDYDADSAEMSWTIGPRYRGKGLGLRMVRLAANQEPGKQLIANIKPTNLASLRIAQSCGFSFLKIRDGFGVWLRAPILASITPAK